MASYRVDRILFEIFVSMETELSACLAKCMTTFSNVAAKRNVNNFCLLLVN